MKKILLILLLTSMVFSSEKTLVNEATAFSYGESKKEILIITDPECPFCKNLAKDKNDKFKNYKVRVILVALPYHKNARQMISYILSAKNNDEKLHRYKEIMIGDDISYKDVPVNKKLLNAYIKKSMKVVKKLGIDRVPSLFDREDDEFFSSSYSEL